MQESWPPESIRLTPKGFSTDFRTRLRGFRQNPKMTFVLPQRSQNG
jgi:hypothetical protein